MVVNKTLTTQSVRLTWQLGFGLPEMAPGIGAYDGRNGFVPLASQSGSPVGERSTPLEGANALLGGEARLLRLHRSSP